MAKKMTSAQNPFDPWISAEPSPAGSESTQERATKPAVKPVVRVIAPQGYPVNVYLQGIVVQPGVTVELVLDEWVGAQLQAGILKEV